MTSMRTFIWSLPATTNWELASSEVCANHFTFIQKQRVARAVLSVKKKKNTTLTAINRIPVISPLSQATVKSDSSKSASQSTESTSRYRQEPSSSSLGIQQHPAHLPSHTSQVLRHLFINTGCVVVFTGETLSVGYLWTKKEQLDSCLFAFLSPGLQLTPMTEPPVVALVLGDLPLGG